MMFRILLCTYKEILNTSAELKKMRYIPPSVQSTEHKSSQASHKNNWWSSYLHKIIFINILIEETNNMLGEGITSPNQSPWFSTIWVVLKKPNYRKVNEKIIDETYSYPNINNIFDKPGRCEYFTSLDIFSRFLQINSKTNYRRSLSLWKLTTRCL